MTEAQMSKTNGGFGLLIGIIVGLSAAIGSLSTLGTVLAIENSKTK